MALFSLSDTTDKVLTAARFAPAETLPAFLPLPGNPGAWQQLRQAARVVTTRLGLARKPAPAPAPESTTVYAFLKRDTQYPQFTAESTVAHLAKGTADSQVPPQEHLLNYLRPQQLTIEAVTLGQDQALKIEIPRWKDAKAIRQRLSIFHPGAISKVIDAPPATHAALTATRPAGQTIQAASITARM